MSPIRREPPSKGPLLQSLRALARDSAGPGCCVGRDMRRIPGFASGAPTFSCVPSDQTTGAWHL